VFCDIAAACGGAHSGFLKVTWLLLQYFCASRKHEPGLFHMVEQTWLARLLTGKTRVNKLRVAVQLFYDGDERIGQTGQFFCRRTFSRMAKARQKQ
jgi:hypothetical protein